MKVLYVTSEAVPFCKTGGLADVAGSLPPSLAEEGAEVAVVLPLYRTIKERFGDQLYFECYDYVNLAWRHNYCGLFSMQKDGVTWYFLDNEQYFDRMALYGEMDDGERFGFFSRAVVQMLPHFRFWPDVVHCNDWQTALVPIYLKDDGVRDHRLRSIRTMLTIHNIEYQGRYGKETLGDLFGLDHGWADDGTILMDGDVNLLKGAILCADAVNAVSPTYANELKMPFFAHRLDSVMRRYEYKLSGVLNGIDLKRYDPAHDPRIAANYSADNLLGKAEDKAVLQRLMGLREEPHVPIVAIVSRLVSHKGLDLVCEVLHDMMQLPIQLVVLGKGDRKYEDFFGWAASQYPGRMAARMDYSEDLSMAIYAGADLFLMPSKSEPCGLAQMIAMRYGTIPVVRETGGLKDTVQPYEAWRDAGNGFTFANYSSSDMLYVLREAAYLYKDYPEAFGRLQQRAMHSDFSWKRSAEEYLHIYAHITGLPMPTPAVPEEPAAEPTAEPTVEPIAEPETVAETATPAAESEEEAEQLEIEEVTAEEAPAVGEEATVESAPVEEAPAAPTSVVEETPAVEDAEASAPEAIVSAEASAPEDAAKEDAPAVPDKKRGSTALAARPVMTVATVPEVSVPAVIPEDASAPAAEPEKEPKKRGRKPGKKTAEKKTEKKKSPAKKKAKTSKSK